MTNLHEVISGYRTNFQKQRLMTMRTAKRIKDSCYWFYFQYLLITCCIDMEPWEQIVVHTIFATTFTMLVFTAYVFIPAHLRLAFRFFLQLWIK
uniref:serine palmitoyltransferase small subunit B-like n=1 Tax=Euleptes europaea TaxID=460621 RepID=UPI00253F8EAC|nr:serine palmitoyltransferase small subunit B-like [Euleptes europaea]